MTARLVNQLKDAKLGKGDGRRLARPFYDIC